jgi:hypothetical protein
VNLRILQAALLAAGIGAVVVLVGLLGDVAALIGLAAILLGTVVAAPAGRGKGGGWWSLLAIGAVLSVLGALVSIASESVGGLIALIGGVLVVAGAAIGFPLAGPAPRSGA